ncbi:hypothetical protein D3C87_1653430 [compost metagenome]
MNKLMAQNVPGLVIQFHYRHDHPVFESFGHTAGSDAYFALQGSSLLEIRMVIVKDDGVLF